MFAFGAPDPALLFCLLRVLSRHFFALNSIHLRSLLFLNFESSTVCHLISFIAYLSAVTLEASSNARQLQHN
jgi:hypothetical protein